MCARVFVCEHPLRTRVLFWGVVRGNVGENASSANAGLVGVPWGRGWKVVGVGTVSCVFRGWAAFVCVAVIGWWAGVEMAAALIRVFASYGKGPSFCGCVYSAFRDGLSIVATRLCVWRKKKRQPCLAR